MMLLRGPEVWESTSGARYMNFESTLPPTRPKARRVCHFEARRPKTTRLALREHTKSKSGESLACRESTSQDDRKHEARTRPESGILKACSASMLWFPLAAFSKNHLQVQESKSYENFDYSDLEPQYGASRIANSLPTTKSSLPGAENAARANENDVSGQPHAFCGGESAIAIQIARTK